MRSLRAATARTGAAAQGGALARFLFAGEPPELAGEQAGAGAEGPINHASRVVAGDAAANGNGVAGLPAKRAGKGGGIVTGMRQAGPLSPMKRLRLRLLLVRLSYRQLCTLERRVLDGARRGEEAMLLALPRVVAARAEAGRAHLGLPGPAPMFGVCRAASFHDARHRPSPPPDHPARAGAAIRWPGAGDELMGA